MYAFSGRKTMVYQDRLGTNMRRLSLNIARRFFSSQWVSETVAWAVKEDSELLGNTELGALTAKL